jgi:hypothetical protein
MAVEDKPINHRRQQYMLMTTYTDAHATIEQSNNFGQVARAASATVTHPGGHVALTHMLPCSVGLLQSSIGFSACRYASVML